MREDDHDDGQGTREPGAGASPSPQESTRGSGPTSNRGSGRKKGKRRGRGKGRGRSKDESRQTEVTPEVDPDDGAAPPAPSITPESGAAVDGRHPNEGADPLDDEDLIWDVDPPETGKESADDPSLIAADLGAHPADDVVAPPNEDLAAGSDMVEPASEAEDLEPISLDDEDIDAEDVIRAVTELATAESVDLVSPDADAEELDWIEAGIGDGLEVDPADLSSPEDRAKLIAQALAHAEAQEARYRRPLVGAVASGWKGATVVVLFLLAGLTALMPPAWVTPAPVPLPNAADLAGGTRLQLYLQARQIEAFRARTERLPRSIEELEAPLPGIRFVRSDARSYQLTAYGPDGRALVYDSTAPDSAFASAIRMVAGPGDTP